MSQSIAKIRHFIWLELLTGILILVMLLWELGWGGLESDTLEGSLLFWVREANVLLNALNFVSILAQIWVLHRYREEIKPRLWVQGLLGVFLLVSFSLAIADVSAFTSIYALNLRRLGSCLLGGIAVLEVRTLYQNALYGNESSYRHSKIPPALVFLITLIFVIMMGAFLLQTPSATTTYLSLVDAFFLSTSAVCVTGLSPVNISEVLAPFGKLVLISLVQIGAFGVMTFTFFVSLMVGQGLSLRERVTISTLLDEESIAQTTSFIKNIIGLTFAIELVGAVALWFAWKDIPEIPSDLTWWYAIFHSISGFCNAGFSLFDENLATPFLAHQRSGQLIILGLVLSGSLGFAVFTEIIQRVKRLFTMKGKHLRLHWSTHSWLVLRMSLLLVLGGGLLLTIVGVFEAGHGANLNLEESVWEGFFNAGARTAGFNITNVAAYGGVYALILCGLMFIGGNPGSTTGGIHTTVFAIACGEVKRILRGQSELDIHYRRVERGIVERAMATVILACMWVSLVSMVMVFIEPDIALTRIVFEVVSSFATVGFSMGVTEGLSTTGKWVILLNMVIGRVGMFSFLLAIMGKSQPKLIRYPETRLPLS